MIKIKQLYALGYKLKTKLLKGGFDLNHSEKNYLLSLSNDGDVTIIYPTNSKRSSVQFIDFDTFQKFHDEN
jgi:hypothetical protein